MTQQLTLMPVAANNAFTALSRALQMNAKEQRRVTGSKFMKWEKREALLTQLTADWNTLNELREGIGTVHEIGGSAVDHILSHHRAESTPFFNDLAG